MTSMFFHTSLCGVLVFDFVPAASVPPPSRLPPPPSRLLRRRPLFVTHHLSHKTFSHTIFPTHHLYARTHACTHPRTHTYTSPYAATNVALKWRGAIACMVAAAIAPRSPPITLDTCSPARRALRCGGSWPDHPRVLCCGLVMAAAER